MSSCVTLTHEDAFANINALEERDSLAVKKIYGFGVDGKRFKIIKMDDSFFTRIWFSFLKLLRFIKADEPSIDRLKKYTFDHIKCNDYRQWAKTNQKVSRVGIKNLIEENQELKAKIKEEKNPQDNQSAEIKGLEQKLANTQSLLATANTDKEEQTKTIEEKDQQIEKLSSDLDKQKKRAAKYKKLSRENDEEKNFFKKAWEALKADSSEESDKSDKNEKSVEDQPKENKQHEPINKKSHKRNKKSEK